MLVELFACFIINIGQRVELIGYDVNIVAADSVALRRDALAFVHTGDGVELAARHLMLDTVEVGSNGVYSCRVTHQYHLVGQEFGLEVQVEARTVTVDN